MQVRILPGGPRGWSNENSPGSYPGARSANSVGFRAPLPTLRSMVEPASHKGSGAKFDSSRSDWEHEFPGRTAFWSLSDFAGKPEGQCSATWEASQLVTASVLQTATAGFDPLAS